MQFIYFIASTMLIVLISQDAIMGLPFNSTEMNTSCSKGYTMIDGQCMPVKTKLNGDELESSSVPVTMIMKEVKVLSLAPTTVELSGACPKGMVHGKNGICEEMKFQDQPSRPAVSTDDNGMPKDCPQGKELDEEGVCQYVTRSKSEKKPVNIKVSPKKDGSCPADYELIEGQCMPVKSKLNVDDIESSSPAVTMIMKEVKVLSLAPTTIELSGACPKGMVHGKNGICKEIQSENQAKPTVAPIDDNSMPSTVQDIPQGCPEGTKPDEQGACQEIKRSNATRKIDPKIFLQKDGSCPTNYKMSEGRCLYVKPKTDPKLNTTYSVTDDTFSTDRRPQNNNEENTPFDSVPVLQDNSCPEGTEYSEYGLCQQRNRPEVPSNAPTTVVKCPNDSEFVNGKCTSKKSKTEDASDLTTKASKISSTTPEPERFNEDQPLKPTIKTNPVDKNNAEFQSEAKLAPF